MLVRTASIIKEAEFDLLVCDEGHRLKNPTIKTSLMLNGLDIKRRIILSGTPVQNDLRVCFFLLSNVM